MPAEVRLTGHQRRALEMLAAAPRGLRLIPGYRQGVSQPTVDRLIALGFASYEPISATTTITAPGRAFLAESAP